MAEFAPAVKLTLEHEGGFFHNKVTGEVVNKGITLTTVRSLGILKSTGVTLQSDIDFIRSLTEEEAKDIYHMEYWDKLHLDHVKSQPIANKVFDLGVNMGVVGAARILQKACHVAEDGIVGEITIGRANSFNEAALLHELKACAAVRYQEIAFKHLELAGNLTGWLNRLNS